MISIKKYYYIWFSLILPLFLAGNYSLYSQLSGTIECITANSDTVQFGACMVGDFKFNTFKITNTGTKDLKLGPGRPSFSIEFSGLSNHLVDHEEFNHNLPGNREMIIAVGETKFINITYDANRDTNTYIFGLKIAKFTIGLYEDGISQPTNKNDFTAYREFTLFSNKVRTYVSGDVYINNYDSVFVNPVQPIEFTWNISNVSDNNVNLDTHKLEWLTPDIYPEEFDVNIKLPLYMPANTGPVPVKFKYSPKDVGEDKIRYSLGYTYNDTLAFTRIELRGFGVNQKLRLMESNSSYYFNDTIDFGKVWVGQEKEIYAVLANDGNMNFLSENQGIYEGFDTDFESSNFQITQPWKDIYYRPTTGDTVKLVFKPDRIGNFIARYRIKSNIDKRPVRGYPPEKLFENIYIKGLGIEPKLQAEFDTVNFGQIISHPDCPSSRTFTLNITNIGNATLTIKDYSIQPPFKIEIGDSENLIFEPNQEKSINIIFSASVLGDYSSVLKLITNANSPNDTSIVHIKASRVNPETISLLIPEDLRLKPGGIVSVPVIVNKQYITNARTFSTELTYNRSILKYQSYDKIKTASENTDDNDIKISELNDGGKLIISFSTPGSQTYFMQRDTLIKLNFSTYIGDKISTPIAFIEPLFGDGICNKILIPSESNGLFTIDSVCGLEYKLIPGSGANFFISEIFPNPVDDEINIQYQFKSEIQVNIDLINQIGLPVKNIFNGLCNSDFYEIKVDCSNLSSGIYYIRFNTGMLTINRKFNIIR